ncbi:MAG: hypothetical protein ABJA35_04710 [Parafilimonas sp.]
MIGFKEAPGAWGTNTAWHLFGPVDFNLDQVMAFANEQNDNCIIEKLKWDILDKNYFKVYIKNQNPTYTFHIIFSTKDGKLYKQTIEYDKKTILSIATEIFI